MINLLDSRLASFEKFVAAFSLLLLLCLSLLQILARNLFDTGFIHVEMLNRHLLLIAGLMGAGVAISEMRHIRIDALTTVMGDALKQRLSGPIMFFSAVTTAALCYYAVIFCMDEWQYAPVNERWVLPLKLVYPCSFAFMTLHFLFAATRPRDR